MPRTKRWLLTWWLVGETVSQHSRWYATDCKLCACKRAWQFGHAYATVKLAPDEAIRWEVSRNNLHGPGPVIVATSSSVSLELIKHHAHRESRSSTIRSAISPRGADSESGAGGLPGGRRARSESDVVSAQRRNGKDGKRS